MMTIEETLARIHEDMSRSAEELDHTLGEGVAALVEIGGQIKQLNENVKELTKIIEILDVRI